MSLNRKRKNLSGFLTYAIGTSPNFVVNSLTYLISASFIWSIWSKKPAIGPQQVAPKKEQTNQKSFKQKVIDRFDCPELTRDNLK